MTHALCVRARRCAYARGSDFSGLLFVRHPLSRFVFAGGTMLL
jgi:hypothetical protein